MTKAATFVLVVLVFFVDVLVGTGWTLPYV